ncbi:DUF3995 domain-containing protein [Oricola nitratireducens]|uniref:DUF3995 domain-containing protein n=1 Tax=Oricola nitratireducens TaxID=2775868 RepID=UPI0018696759|nr:DUF3995 domain-containing protein [Oricola nitratireducens]
MIALGIVLSAILTALALLHLAWGAKIWWPVRDEAALTHAIAGFRGMARMPDTLSCLVVALALFTCALLVAALSFASGLPWLPDTLVLIASGIAGLVFLSRGLAGYTSAWARLTPEQPFRTLDRRYYSPLCIGVGLGIAALIWSN